MTTLIKDANVLEGDRLVQKDILIGEDGRIESVGHGLEGDQTVHADGLVALPGVIDAHVHLREPGLTKKEDFLSGTMAAVKGGVTSVIDMPNSIPQTTTVEALLEKRDLAKKAVSNIGFYFGMGGRGTSDMEQAKNIAGIKLFLGSSTGDMLTDNDALIGDVLEKARLVGVHAEDERIIQDNKKRYSDSSDPSTHSLIRSPEAAEKSVSDILARHQGKKAHLHICHASTKAEIGLVALAKARGQDVSMEACTHHLFLDISAYKRLGTLAQMNPPLRTKDQVAALWDGLRDGTVDTVATDHAPHLREEKEVGFPDAPSGVPGVENLLPLMLDAVAKERITLPHLVDLSAHHPARIFGIEGKGFLQKGFDADIVLVDRKEEHTIRDDEQLTKCGWTPYDGMKVRGWPKMTFVNGIVVNDGGATDKRSKGKELSFGSLAKVKR
ncbi:MAG: dihydroorotase [archaeon]